MVREGEGKCFATPTAPFPGRSDLRDAWYGMLRIPTEEKRVSQAEQFAASGSFAVRSIRCGAVNGDRVLGLLQVETVSCQVSVQQYSVYSLYTATVALKVFLSAVDDTSF